MKEKLTRRNEEHKIKDKDLQKWGNIFSRAVIGEVKESKIEEESKIEKKVRKEIKKEQNKNKETNQYRVK